VREDSTTTIEELQRRLAIAEGALKALRSGQVDTLQGEHGMLSVRPAEAVVRAEHIKRVLLAIRNVNKLIISEDDPLRLITRACANLTETLGYLNAWVALVTGPGGAVRATASSGFGGELPALSRRIEAGDTPECMTRALDHDGIIVVADPVGECPGCPLSCTHGGGASLCRRLRYGDVTFGVLGVSVPASFASDEEEQVLFDEVASDLAFALHKIESARRLRETEADLDRAHALAHIGSWRFDLNTGVVIACKEARRIYGLGDAEWTVERVQTLPLAQYRSALDAALENLVHQGTPYDIEFEVRRPSDDAVRWIRSVAEYDAERRVVFGTLRDITERKRAEETLLARERYLNAILQTAADGFWVMGSTGRILEVNDAYCKMSGHTRAELMAMSIADLDMNEAPAQTAARIQRIIANGFELFETRHRRKNGSPMSVEISATWLNEDGGRFVCFCRDLTERRERDDRIASLGQMVDNAPASIVVHGTDGSLLFVNQATAALHGYDTEAEVLALHLDDLDVAESRELQPERFHQIAEKGFAHFEVVHRRKDGSTFPLEVVAKSIMWNGRPALLSVAVDITERKRADEELRKQGNVLERIFEVLPVGLWITDKEGTLLRGNPAGVEIWGAEPHVSISEYGVFKAWRLPSREPIQPEDWALAKTIRHGEAFLDELLEIESFDGKRKTILNYTIPLLDDGGRVEGAIVVNLDISDRVALEEQLRQAQKIESIGRLAGGVAHDFNNMLCVIIGNAQFALESVAPDHPIRPDLLQVLTAAQRSADVTRQLLAFARKQTIAPRVLDLNDAVSGMLKVLSRLIGENVELRWVPGTPLWPIKMDPSQVDQILANLCVNARDAIAGTGTLTLETSNVVIGQGECAENPHADPGDYVLLTVQDDGCGMDRQTLDQIFEPFFTTKGVGQGTGLGLATVYGIVKQNRGFVGIQTELGKGTVFRIHVPRHVGGVQSGSLHGAEDMPTGHGETVLLVEDEAAILKLATRMLETLGYTVLAAAGPDNALRLVASHAGAIDLLVTDVVMPGMSGKELSERVRAACPLAKVLYVSGYTADVIAHHGVLDEGVLFMEKPFSMKDMATKVQQALNR
jgi:two-component system cell cycle sensor histidine kinase/response regulator CckA